MIHISDLSWLKVSIILLNTRSRTAYRCDDPRLSKGQSQAAKLGHKQLEEDPWNALEETFAVGSIHEGTVIRKVIKALSTIAIRIGRFCPQPSPE